MLKPPFSQPILLLQPAQPTTLTSSIETAPDLPSRPSAISICHIQPVAIRSGNTIARIQNDPDAYYTTELWTGRLDEIKTYLWLAGLPSSARALHRQQLLGRQILITEDPNEHLIWHETRIFVKPLPTFLFSLDCWTEKICKSKQLYEAGCGLLLSYAWLIRHESDLRIAHEKALLPAAIDWVVWTEFINDFLKHVDLQSLSGVSARFQYGELRLSRLNMIYFFTRFKWRGYMTASSWYRDFFDRHFAWLLIIFAVMSVALSAMQVVVATTRSGQAFENTSYGFSVASLFLIAGSASVVLLLWIVLFLFHLVSAQLNDLQVMRERKRFVYVQSDLGYQEAIRTT